MRPDNPTILTAFMTLPAFCKAYGFKLHALRRAANSGLIPVYQPFGSRRYLHVEQTLAFITSCREGGPQ